MDKFTESLTKGRFQESLAISANADEATAVTESAKQSGKELPKSIEVTVEAIHAGMTKNKTFYSAQNLETSTPSWTTPYDKPVIKNHDTWEEPTGRVKSATFKQSVLKPDTHTIELKMQVTDPDAIQKVIDGRYLTLSIGGSTDAATCSICGKNIVTEGWCGHSRGKKYEGKEAYWIIGNMEFDEISWVNVPADVNAQVVHIKQSVEQPSAERRGESVDNLNMDEIDNVLNESEQPTPDPEVPAIVEGEIPAPTPEPEVPVAPQESGEQTPEEKIAVLEAQVQTLTTERDAEKLAKETVISEKDALTQTVTEKDASIAEKDAELTQVKADRDMFRNKNVTLAKMAQRILAERAVDLRVVLGELNKEDRETALSESASKPAKVLEAEIQALLAKPAVAAPRESTKVVSPGAVIPGANHSIDENGDVVEGAGAEAPKELSIEDLGDKIVEFITLRAKV